MNNHVVLKCKDCGTVMVVRIRDLWKLKRCTHCESTNVDIVFEEENNEQ